MFFGIGSTSLHRCIVHSLLKQLSNIRHWFIAQRCYHFYASSLLLVYEGDIDTEPKHCRRCQEVNNVEIKQEIDSSQYICNGDVRATAGATSTSAAVCERPSGPVVHQSSAVPNDVTSQSSAYTGISQIDRTYADVRMIDFAHVFAANCSKDDNYIFGLDNLIKLLERILSETS